MTQIPKIRREMKIRKMRKVAILSLLLLIPLAVVAGVYAARPTVSTNGTFTLTSQVKIGASRIAGSNTIVMFKNNFSLAGPLNGHLVTLERDVIHNDTLTVNFHGRGTFTGSTTAGKMGTLTINYVGRANSTDLWGQFTILGGTAGLATLRGQGTFQGMGLGGTYTLRWHIAPSA